MLSWTEPERGTAEDELERREAEEAVAEEAAYYKRYGWIDEATGLRVFPTDENERNTDEAR